MIGNTRFQNFHKTITILFFPTTKILDGELKREKEIKKQTASEKIRNKKKQMQIQFFQNEERGGRS
jgi:hypothetical protein